MWLNVVDKLPVNAPRHLEILKHQRRQLTLALLGLLHIAARMRVTARMRARLCRGSCTTAALVPLLDGPFHLVLIELPDNKTLARA